MQTKTLASLKHAHIGPALAMIALAVAALGLSACGRVVPAPPKDKTGNATSAQEATKIDLTSKALRGVGDHFCYELTAKTETTADGKETDKQVKDEEICIAGTDTPGLYKVTTDSKELVDAGFNGLKVVPVVEETVTPAKKMILDESLMAAAAEAPKGEAKKEEEKKLDHKEHFAKAIDGKPEKEGDKPKIILQFSGSLTETESKTKKEIGALVIGDKKHKYKYSRSKI